MSCEKDYPEIWESHTKLCTENNTLEKTLESVQQQLLAQTQRADIARALANKIEEMYVDLVNRIADNRGDY